MSTANNAVAIAASESGGLWKTTNTGANWSLLSGLPTFRMSDVKMDPGNPQIVIATSWFDSHVTNGGGIWRSTDGGTTWQKPPTADPTPGFGCPTFFNTWGISFAPGTNDVFVGTDCGVSVSHDLGVTWSQVTLPAVYGIVAQRGSSGTIVDTCEADGHRRSTDGGATWTPSSAALPGCPFIGVHTIAVSPLEPNVLFAAIGKTSIYESDNGGVLWSNLNPPANIGSRLPWVATHLSADGNPDHFDIYFGSGLNTYRQTCTNTGGPGLRCSTSWTKVTIDHSDQNGLAFSTSGNCAQYIVSDGGIHTTSDCGATWTITGNGPGGYHALQVYEVGVEVHPGSTDVYMGTQDNELWASNNNGLTWINPYCCEGFFIQTLHDSPSDAGQNITFVACTGCANEGSSADFTSVYTWNNPPKNTSGNPFIVSQNVYVQWSAPSPPANQLYLTSNTGSTWSPVSGASTTFQLVDHPFVTGPSANPTIYQGYQRTNGTNGLLKITGVLSGPALVTTADAGLGNIGTWCMGQATFRCPLVFGVDPNNSLHLIAADIGVNQMMVSLDGGSTWNPDTHLTALVTNFGQFRFTQPITEAHTIAFDPSNGNRILVGTEQAGIIVSTDGGNTWGVVLGSSAVPAVSSFSFDEVQMDVFASSYGRGIWKLNLSELVTFPPVITKTFSAPSTPLNGSVTLTFGISNPNQTTGLTGVGFSDTLPAGLVVTGSVSGTGCGAFAVSGLPNSIIVSDATIAVYGTCTLSAIVTGTAPGVMNNVTGNVFAAVSGSGNYASATLVVIAPPAITKTFTATKILPGGTTGVTFSITNPNSFAALTGVAFTDSLPPGLVVASPSGLSSNCGGTPTANAGTGTISLLGGSIVALGSCTLTASVTAPEGIYNNSVQVTSTNGGTGNTASATVYVATPPNVSKAFGTVDLLPSGSTALTFTVANPNHVVTLTGIMFSDTLPLGLLVSNPNGLVGSCDGGTIAAAAASNLINLSGASLAPGASCTFSVNVTAGSTELGLLTNTTSAVTSTDSIAGTSATATIFVGDAYQVSYTANLTVGDSYVNISNSGANGGVTLQTGTSASVGGSICLNVYAFTPDEEIVACCSCPVTPNGLVSLSGQRDLITNPLTRVTPTSIVIKLVATVPVGGSCTNSAAAVGTTPLAAGLAAWGTTLHVISSVGAAYAVTESQFTPSDLSASELRRLGATCSFILGQGSGFGVCNSCSVGGLGAINQ